MSHWQTYLYPPSSLCTQLPLFPGLFPGLFLATSLLCVGVGCPLLISNHIRFAMLSLPTHKLLSPPILPLLLVDTQGLCEPFWRPGTPTSRKLSSRDLVDSSCP
mmetsp:Transcript_18145/g.31324  ORF Transcript_18145/g.31324 Transcript_18145/m.31324 type:complete len:104 (+) Transcript_18145:239-550(+)